MRMKFMAALAVAGGLALGASQAQATQFVGSWSLEYLNADPGLVLQVQPINPTFNFALSPDDPNTAQNEELKTLSLFKLYTNETSVNADDLIASPIKLTFNFSAPTPNTVDPITGVTSGYSEFFGYIQGGKLTWANNGVTQLHFGNGLTGLMTIKVNGGEYNEGGFWSTDEGISEALTVKAKFDWDRDATAVPEPATWALMLGGFGLAGTALRRRRALAA